MKWIKKLLLRFLFSDLYLPGSVDQAALKEWLRTNHDNDGFKSYYTMRKKYLMGLLALGIEGKEYWETVGRLKELKALTTNINTAVGIALDKKKKDSIAKKI